MPSSLIFAGLVVIWLLILVPAVVRHQQDVTRPTVDGRAGRVSERPWRRRDPKQYVERDELDSDQESRVNPRAAYGPTRSPDTRSERRAAPSPPSDDRAWEPPPPRRYRPGRGGFDPQAAALAARQRYVFRQRVVLTLLLLALVTGVIAAVGLPVVWWVHVGIDLLLAAYLTYLRRQVRLEEAIRARRAARLAAARRSRPPAAADPTRPAQQDREPVGRDPRRERYGDEIRVPEMRDHPELERRSEPDASGGRRRVEVPASREERRWDVVGAGDVAAESDREERALPRLVPVPPPPLPEGTTLVEDDDVEIELHELDAPDDRWGHRRAAG